MVSLISAAVGSSGRSGSKSGKVHGAWAKYETAPSTSICLPPGAVGGSKLVPDTDTDTDTDTRDCKSTVEPDCWEGPLASCLCASF